MPKVTIQRVPEKSSLSTLLPLTNLLEEVRLPPPGEIPPFREGKHRVRLYASRSSGQRPGPTFAARGPNGIEKKCAFLQGQNYDTVDKENTISRNAEKTAPVCPCEPLCRTNGGGEASIMPAKPSLSPCWGWVAKERDTSHLHWPSSSNGKMT